MKLRDYQQLTIDQIREHFTLGKTRVLVHLPTGAGKSRIFQKIVMDSLLKGKRVLFLVRRQALIHQVETQFTKLKVECSVLMSNRKGFDKKKHFQIFSIDTAIKRDLTDLVFDLCVVDEAHDATSEAYQTFLNNLNCKFFVGFTATPYRIGKRGHTFWQAVSAAIGMPGLVERGFLTDAKLFGPPTKADLKSVSVQAGEYNQKQLGEEMSKLQVVADVVDTYKKLGQNKAAICFCVNKTHSLTLADKFNRAGIPALHADCDSTKEERDEAIQLLESGKIKVICNVNIWSTGVDVPCLEVCILARPTKSVNLYLQQVGRAFRPYRICGSSECGKIYDNSDRCYHCGHPSPRYIKQYAIVLDHGENIKRHGQPHIFRKAQLTDYDPLTTKQEGEIKIKQCKRCHFIIEDLNAQSCPMCALNFAELPAGGGGAKINETDGKLVEYQKSKVVPLTQEQIAEKFREVRERRQNLKNNHPDKSWGSR
jgi:superfamily II DNA or RNA helicase